MSSLTGLVSQWEVVHALILRETRTRFGAHQIGYLWALLEPALMILTFFVLFHVASRQPPFGMDLFSFVGTGIIPYTLFSSTANRVAESINGNKALLFYPHVQPLDLAIARSLLELGTSSSVFLLLMGANALYTQQFEIDDALLVVLGFTLASGLGAGLGLIFCSLSQFSKSVERARGPLLRPLFWTSGIFFTLESLPSTARDILVFNPVLHAVETVRTGWFDSYSSDYVNPMYSLMWIIALSFVGLAMERAVRRRIEVT